jgi:hypothetical protein
MQRVRVVSSKGGVEITPKEEEDISMNKGIAFAALAGGILLLVLGVNAYDSTSSDIARFFTGSATDKSLWLLIGGTFVTVLGLAFLLRKSKTV